MSCACASKRFFEAPLFVSMTGAPRELRVEKFCALGVRATPRPSMQSLMIVGRSFSWRLATTDPGAMAPDEEGVREYEFEEYIPLATPAVGVPRVTNKGAGLILFRVRERTRGLVVDARGPRPVGKEGKERRVEEALLVFYDCAKWTDSTNSKFVSERRYEGADHKRDIHPFN